MKLYWLILSFGLLASCQTAWPTSLLPSCALPCLPPVASNLQCDTTDLTCYCTDSNFFEYLTHCLDGYCQRADDLVAVNITVSACNLPTGDRRTVARVVPSVFLGLTLFSVGLRVIERPPFTGLFGWDDFFILLAEFIFIPMTVTLIYEPELGFGLDVWRVPRWNFDTILIIGWVNQMLYILLNVLTKLSMLAFYNRLFRDKRFHKISLTVIGVSICYGITFIFLTAFQCKPAVFYFEQWDASASTGTCIDPRLIVWIVGAINIALDLVTIGIPIPQVLYLQLNLRKRIQLIAMFSVGFFITIISCIRLKTNVQNSSAENFSYDNVPLAYWSVVETGTAIICACLPAMMGLYRRARGLRTTVKPTEYSATKQSCTMKTQTDDIPKDIEERSNERQDSEPVTERKDPEAV